MYHGCGPARETSSRRAASRCLAVGAALLLALAAGGCSISMPLGSVTGDHDGPTGSTEAPSPLSREHGVEDWRRARAALGVALDPQGTGAGVSWDNPDSGAKGNFSAVGQPFVQDDEVCRAFLAVLHGPAEATLQGTACRPSGGEWSIKEVKPFRRPS